MTHGGALLEWRGWWGGGGGGGGGGGTNLADEENSTHSSIAAAPAASAGYEHKPEVAVRAMKRAIVMSRRTVVIPPLHNQHNTSVAPL